MTEIIVKKDNTRDMYVVCVNLLLICKLLEQEAQVIVKGRTWIIKPYHSLEDIAYITEDIKEMTDKRQHDLTQIKKKFTRTS